jgi:integrase
MSGYRSILTNHLIPAFGDTPLGNIDAVNVQTWIAQLQRTGLSPSRIRQCHSALHSILDLAVRSRYIAANPAHKAQLPRIPPREPRYLNPQQVADLAAAVDPRYETLILTLAYAGLRWGEAVGLKRDRVDLARNRLIIGETLSEVDGKLYTVAPKTHRRREVVIPPFLHTMLVNHLRDVDELVWTTPSGKPLRSSNFRKKVWIPALETAGIEYLRVHDLRHTAASLMISAGASPKAIAGQLGHNSIKVTMDTYGHLFPSDQDALAAALDRQWKEAQEASGEGVAPLTRPASDSNVVPIGRG